MHGVRDHTVIQTVQATKKCSWPLCPEGEGERGRERERGRTVWNVSASTLPNFSPYPWSPRPFFFKVVDHLPVQLPMMFPSFEATWQQFDSKYPPEQLFEYCFGCVFMSLLGERDWIVGPYLCFVVSDLVNVFFIVSWWPSPHSSYCILLRSFSVFIGRQNIHGHQQKRR